MLIFLKKRQYIGLNMLWAHTSSIGLNAAILAPCQKKNFREFQQNHIIRSNIIQASYWMF